MEFWHPLHEMGASMAKKPSRKLYISTTSVWLGAWESLWGPSNTFSLFALHGGYSLVAGCGCLIAVVSLVAKPGV